MFRNRALWAGIALFCAACLWFAATYFYAASPIVTVDLRMDREAALVSAAELTARHGWGPEGFRQAASFRQLDRQVQMYVELEGGGREAFQQMLDEGHYQAYVWAVRHFRPEEATETEIRFTPGGRPYGFAMTLPEDEPGASLGASEARDIAERAAREDWRVALEEYELIESSQETRPAGRTDHWFVYERPDLHVGEARYRVRLGVAGDRFSQLTHFVHVPEGFTRRFAEMRSRNMLISLASTIAFVLLFIIGGCGVGLFHLLRRRWVVWRTPLFAGGGVALLVLLAGVNELPLAWMHYDTAVSPQAFLARHIATLAALFVGLTAFVTLVVMAAESLSRRAFPAEIQLWRLWSPQAARSDSVLGRTLGGYAFAAFGLASVVAFYLVMMRLPGWWSPSDTLLRPDLLATPLPSLSAIAMALMAGVWEESVFRAIPIAGAALIGARFGRPRLWIAAAVIFQALVFAAAHADYPQQPAYARVLEIFPDALLWGVAYVFFGLFPVILAHFTYNLAWMSLPLFIAEGPGLWLDRVLVIAAALVPLAIVLQARFRYGALPDAPVTVRNGAWTPPASPAPDAREALTPPDANLPPAPIGARVRPAFVAAAAIGLALFVALTSWRSEWPRMDPDRQQAVALARGELDERGIALGDQWRALPSIQGRPGEASEFVWRTGGPGAYGRLLGHYLPGPHWNVRFAHFEGPVEERAEEFIVTVAADGGITRFQHRLPEARPGATLEEEEGRRLAQAAIVSEFKLDPARLREVSAVADRRPHRQDWTFTYADPAGYPLDDGEARIRVVVAGDRVADAFRFVHVPEEWSRARRAERNRATVVGIVAAVLLVFLLGGGAAGGVVRWSRGGFPVRIVLAVFAGHFVIQVITALNGWPAVAAQFMTAQPFAIQAFGVLAFLTIAALLMGAVTALIAGLVQVWPRQRGASSLPPAFAGVCTGAAAAGLVAIAQFLAPARGPFVPPFEAAASFAPSLTLAIGPVATLLLQTAGLLLILRLLDRLTIDGTRRQPLAAALALVAGLVVAGMESHSLAAWLVSGLAAGAVVFGLHQLALRHHVALVPVFVATLAILGQVQLLALRPHAGAVVGPLLSIVLIAMVALAWSRALERRVSPAAVLSGVGRDVSAG